MTSAARVAVIGAGVLSSVLTARLLQPAGRGEYFFVVTFAQSLVQLASLGLHSSNTYLVARDRSLLAPLLANSVWISIVAGAGIAIPFVLAAQLGLLAGTQPMASLWCAVLLVPASLFYLLGGNLLVGLREMVRFNSLQVGGALLVLLSLAAAGLLGAGPAGFLLASAVGWTIVGLVLLATLDRLSYQALAFDVTVFRRGLGYAQRAYLTTLLGFLVLRSNVFVLNGLQGSEEVGYYSVAAQFADVLAILPQSAALVLFPVLVQQQNVSFQRTLAQMASMAPLLGAACLGIGLAAPPIVSLAYGAEFLPAVPILRWMLPSVFFLGLTSIASQYLAATGFPMRLVGIWAVGLVTVLVLSQILIRQFAGIGAPVALSVTHALIFVLVLGLSRIIHLQRQRAAADATTPQS